jgi:hypothetical protein
MALTEYVISIDIKPLSGTIALQIATIESQHRMNDGEIDSRLFKNESGI